MAHTHSTSIKNHPRYTLRIVSTASAVCGLLINIIALNLVMRMGGWRSSVQLTEWAFLPVCSLVS